MATCSVIVPLSFWIYVFLSFPKFATLCAVPVGVTVLPCWVTFILSKRP